MAIPHQYLPHEIVTDIFLRLPAETLSNARFVNKFWFDFISSSDFVSAHLQKSKKDKTLSCHRVIHSTGDSHLSLEQFSIESSSSRNSFSINNTSLDDIDFSNSSRPSVCFVGSCNGLVCLVLNESHVVLWNPCTGSYNRLPQLLSHGGNKADLLYPDFTYGFGYDEVNDDYKVVALLSFSGLHVMDEETYCTASVYSLKRNSWKRFYPDFAGGVPSWCFGKPVSGKVHWLLDRNIVAFDLANEMLAKVDLPSYGDGCYDRRLDVLDGCLCLLLKDADGTKVDLWVMKEYGVKESWIKMFTIPCANVLGRFDWGPRCLLPNGEILFDFLESFAVCNPKDSSFRFLGIRRFDHGFGPLTYVQSLVSPFGTGRRRRTEVKLVSNVIFTVIVGAFLTLVYLFE